MESPQQFCESSIQADISRAGRGGGSAGAGDADSAAVARPAVDAASSAPQRGAAAQATDGNTDLSAAATASADRAAPQHTLDAVCLADLWRSRLMARGWSRTASDQLPMCLARSTRANYDRHIQSFCDYCSARGTSFPPTDSAVLADFLVLKCSSSNRPHSLLRCITAAISALYEITEISNPVHDPLISRLSQAIIKSGTRAPMARSSVMNVAAFVRLFESWPDNSGLSLKRLRLKVISLLAIALMLRPSDIAPLAESYNAGSGVVSLVMMTTDQLVFSPDGALQVTFWGIKNDTQRTGFQVSLPPGTNPKADPVAALRAYLDRTTDYRCPVTKPVLLTLVRPYTAITASTVSHILQDAIHLAEPFGLAPGHTPKDFRPTGATRAVELGFDTDDVQRLGRWKTRSVFLEHYVHNRVDPSFTAKMFG